MSASKRGRPGEAQAASQSGEAIGLSPATRRNKARIREHRGTVLTPLCLPPTRRSKTGESMPRPAFFRPTGQNLLLEVRPDRKTGPRAQRGRAAPHRSRSDPGLRRRGDDRLARVRFRKKKICGYPLPVVPARSVIRPPTAGPDESIATS